MRDEVLAAVRARNARAIESGDAGLVLETDALVEAATLLALVTGPAADPEQPPDVEVLHAVGWLYWLRAQKLPVDQMDEELEVAAGLLQPVFAADPEAVPDLMRDFYKEAGASPADGGLRDGRNDPDMCMAQAGILYEWYERFGDVEALQVAVRLYRAAVAATPGGHRDRAEYLSNLWSALRRLALRTGEVEALREAVAVVRAAVTATPEGHPVQAGYLSDLGATLRALFDSTGEPDALREAVIAGRAAVNGASDGDPDWGGYLGELGSTLLVSFGQTGDMDTLREAVAAHREVLAATPDEDPSRVECLSDLGGALQALFEHTGDIEALREAVEVGRAALAAIPHGHPGYGALLSNLGNFLRTWFGQTGDLNVLHEAADLGRAAVAATREDDPARAGHLSNVAGTLQVLFEHTGDLDTLQEAVTSGRAAAADPGPHRAIFLANLGVSLRTLFEHTGDLDTLREAVAAHRESVAATSGSHPNRASRLTNLANTLRALSRRTGDLGLLREAVTVGRDAVAATPEGHPGWAASAANLTNTLYELADRTDDVDALREAVALGRTAVSITPDGHPSLPNYLSSLAVGLQTLSGRTGDLEALAEAITVGRAAVAAAHDGHPGLSGYQIILASALLSSARQTGNQDDLRQARSALSLAAGSPTAAVSERINAGRRQSGADTEAGDHLSALAAMEGVVSLLPLAASRELRRADREFRLSETSGIAGRAAAAALGAGRPERAVELLEQARGLLLAEIIDARSEQRRLEAQAPDLAGKFAELRDRLTTLQTAPSRGTGDPAHGTPSQQDAKWHAQREATRQLADQRREAAAQWEALLTTIRARPGLADFLTPPAVASLQRQASDGPVVIVTSDYSRCDALILNSSPDWPVRHIPLLELTQNTIVKQAERLIMARHIATASTRSSDRREARSELHEILGWLWDTITAPILTALGYSTVPEPDQAWPRVWWCPVGVMAYLPLHAAGHHYDIFDGSSPRRAVLDRVVSSYISTIRALAYARQESRSRTTADRTLIVAMPDTPGTAALPGTEQEARRLVGLLPGATLIQGHDATRDAVLAALPLHSLAHFSCHGVSDQDDPSASHLLLHDHTTRPLNVTAISRLHLTADLAFLSACSTTQTSPRLVDEAVHITAAFQLAGYRNVIGTLWPVYDYSATQIADDVYTDLTGDGTHAPDARRAALALHHAIRRLRDDHLDDPTLWAAHIHAGI